MNTITNQINKITSNPVGAVVGGVAVWYGAKKFANVSNMYVLGLATIVGVIGGAMIQANMSKKGAPTAATTK